MNWLVDVSLIWFEWQVRATIFAIVVVWAALGTGLRSPVWRCAILIVGSWILILFPVLLLVAPAVEIPILASGWVGLSNLDGVQGYLVTTVFMGVVLATSLLLIPIFKSLTRLIRLHSSLREAEAIQTLFDECKAHIGLADRAQLGGGTKCYTSTLAEAPLTYGIGRHYVVLPESALGWSREDLKVCLIHELWHVKRADWLSQQVVSLVSLFNILNPIVWVMRRELGKKIEASVDKLCIQSGVDSYHYADVLLRQARAGKFTAGFMSPTYFGAHRYGSADIQQRIGLLVDEPFGWESVSVRKLLPLSLLLFVVAVFLCSLQPTKRLEQPFKQHSRWIPISEVSIEASHDFLQPGYSYSVPVYANHEVLVSPPVAYFELIFHPTLWTPGSDDIQIPQVPNSLVAVAPEFPKQEADRGREGWVELVYDLNERGEPISLRVVESSGSSYFERAALGALSQSRFDLSSMGPWITEYLTQTYEFQFVDTPEVGGQPRSPP